ncbi:amidohydrolase [Microbispora catharanthi]|uniref:Amidohydrolase family protein n=1 Tax=Microbispora catharanthi TaxID=1712871 RepID=A0A5N6C2V0_9ACTN|nr:amidohydrolase [Microbispora catharanthi]KAB8187114.1 amidohydrolase family protein [Microbispora catharanthi]
MRLDVLFVNGRFTTLDPGRPAATRLGVFAGRIAGLDEDLDGLTAEAVVDLGGAPVVPGFNDAHHHLSMRGQRLRELNLRDGQVRTLEELYAKVAERAAGLPQDAWVKGAGYDQNKLGGLHPSREALDRAAGGRPVWLQHVSGHMGVANTAAFARMGFDRVEDVPDVAGGTVGRDADGRPDGLLAEQAQGLADAVLRPVPFEDFVEGIALAGRVAAGEGLTSFTEPGIGRGLAGNGAWDLAAFQEAVRRGVLPQRATLMPGSPNLHDIGDGWFGLDLGFRTGIGDERLRIGPVKLFSDGSLIGRTAAMCCDYEGEPGNRGLLQQDAEALRAFILRAHAAGWQIATHAIGDHAVDVVLDAYEEAQARDPRPDARHRIEHCAVTGDAQVARIARLGVIPVPQGRFVSELGDGMLAALGPERSLGCYRQRSFLEAGIVVPGSSDCPVADGAPLLGIHDLVNRRTASGVPFTPTESLTVEQALRAYTIGSAYAAGEERHKGTLSRGKLADFVVLGDDLFAVAPERIKDVAVLATVVGGALVFDAAGLSA